jgi:hypothetical protein
MSLYHILEVSNIRLETIYLLSQRLAALFIGLRGPASRPVLSLGVWEIGQSNELAILRKAVLKDSPRGLST